LKKAENVDPARCSDVCGYLSFFRVKEISIEEEGRPAGSECLRMLASAGGLRRGLFASRAKGR
jgi:hypothetical protein